jgi:general nucleoside transport system permease protein
MELDIQFFIEFLQASVRVATPVAFVAMGAAYSERSGVYAMGLEGYMLMSCFASVAVTIYTGSLFLGIIAGILAGMLTSSIVAYSAVILGGEQVLSALSMNIFALGFTGFMQRFVWGVGTGGLPLIEPLQNIPIPLLFDIPVLGPIIFNQPILTYLAYITIPIAWWVMFKSKWGLQLRAVGEHPRAADTVGLPVARTRFMAVVISGGLSALGGAVLSLQQVRTFTEGMTNGRGWLGLIACIFGRWNPAGAAGAAFLFGAADALQLRVQLSSAVEISSYFILMLPHLLALTLILFIGKAARHPAATGIHYTKE